MANSRISDDMKPFRRGKSKSAARLWGMVEIDPFLLKPGFQKWVLLVLVSLVIAVLFRYPSVESREFRDYEVGDIAQEDVFAPRDILMVDEAATESKRRQAAEETWPVFDYDADFAKNAVNRVHEAFQIARDFYSREWDWEQAEANRVKLMREMGRSNAADAIPFIPDEDYTEREAELRRRFAETLSGDEGKPLEITDRMWSDFKKDHFSEKTENKISTLLLQVLNEGVAPSKDDLPTGAGKGITVRALRTSGKAEEYPKGDISSILGVEEAQKLIRDRALAQFGREISWFLRNAIVKIAAQLVKPNYTFNKSRTKAEKQDASSSASQVYIQIKKGEKIVEQGEPVTEKTMKRISMVQGGKSPGHALIYVGGNFMWICALLAMLYTFSSRNIRKFKPSNKDLVHIAINLVLMVAILKLVMSGAEEIGTEQGPYILYIIPMMAGAMLIRLVLNSEMALVFSIVLSIISAALTGSPYYGIYVLTGSIVGAEAVGQAKTRSELAKAGLVTGAANIFVVLAIALVQGEFAGPLTFYNSLLALGGGLIASFFVLGFAPLVENLFGYVTDIRLLELANQEHPLLKALIMNAPGTYQHSITLGILSEEAAKAIHVNPLLVKVAALYHDIGKMEKPSYFVENQKETGNPHERLNPTMSSLIISSHVRYGVELAKMYRLPQIIVDVIPQHHGTSLMKYFYHKAREKEDPELNQIEEKDFRYPGPKPQTREAGIIMLADSVEAAARSLPEPTPAKLRNQVKKIIGNIFSDGQLDECELTLKDLNAIAEAFINVLTSMYHSRPEYPEMSATAAKTDEGRKKVGNQNPPREGSDESGREGKGENSKKGKEGPVRSGV